MPHQLLHPHPGMGAMPPVGPGRHSQQNSPVHPRYPHPAAGGGALAQYPGGAPYAPPLGYPPRFAYQQMPGPAGGVPPQSVSLSPRAAAAAAQHQAFTAVVTGQQPPQQQQPRQPGGHLDLPYRRSHFPQQVSPPRPTSSLVRSPQQQQQQQSGPAVVSAPPAVLGNKVEDTGGTQQTAVRQFPRPIEHSDSAEDIAASALLLCGGGGRMTASSSAGSVSNLSIKRNIGSPSFEESQQQQQQQQQQGGSSSGSVANNAAAAQTTESPKEDATNDGTTPPGPCHVSPASTASSADAADHDEAAANNVASGGSATPALVSAPSSEPSRIHLTHSSKLSEGVHSLSERTAASAPGRAQGTPPVIKLPHFPSLLHDVLTHSRHAGTVLEWLPHGQGWRVLRWDDMVRTVIPEHFPDFGGRATAASEPSSSSLAAQSRDEEDEREQRNQQQHDGRHKQKQQADMNAFLWHVRAWGFRDVREVGPDMGSYRHSLFLRGNPNLCQQMRLTGPMSAPKAAHSSPLPAATRAGTGAHDTVASSSSSATGTPNSHYSALQVPSLTSSLGCSSPGSSKRKIGQQVVGPSGSADGSSVGGGSVVLTAPSSPQHLFQQHGQGQQQQGRQQTPPTQGVSPIRKISDATQQQQQHHLHKHGMIFRHGPPPPSTGGGGRISSLRGRNRRAGGAPRPSLSAAAPAPAASSSASSPGRAGVDRRDETEHRPGRSPANAPSFPVSTRGRGRTIVRAPLHHPGAVGVASAGAAPSSSVTATAHSVGERVSAAVGIGGGKTASAVGGSPAPAPGPAAPLPMMMKGVSAAAVHVPSQYHGVAVAVSRKTKRARLQK